MGKEEGEEVKQEKEDEEKRDGEKRTGRRSKEEDEEVGKRKEGGVRRMGGKGNKEKENEFAEGRREEDTLKLKEKGKISEPVQPSLLFTAAGQ